MDSIYKLTKLRADLPHLSVDKPPRVYANEIIAMSFREDRRKALEQVPENIRPIVKFYIYDAWAKVKRTPLPDLEKSRSEGGANP